MAPGDHNTIIFARADVWKTTTAQTATSSSGWTSIASTATVGGSVSAIGISPLTTNKIYIGTSGGRILVTTNNGTNWAVNTGFPYVTDFVVDPVDDNICYASFGGSSSNHVQKTTNGGVNWTNISAGLPNISANSLILKTASTRTLVVGMDAGVFYTINEGVNWVSNNAGLPNVEVYDLKYHIAASGGILMAATHGRGCWTLADDPLPVILAFFSYSVNDNSVTLRWATQQEINNSGFDIERKKSDESNNDYFKIGTVKGNGTTNETKYYSFADENLSVGKYNYRLKQYDFNGNFEYHNLSGDVKVNPPETYQLFQNFPNPFNPVTNIKFNIPNSTVIARSEATWQSQSVSLKIYDITGREIQTLVNEQLIPGTYEVTFDGTNLASGIYLYVLKAGDFTDAKRMMLLK
jgi:hypothetical protein